MRGESDVFEVLKLPEESLEIPSHTGEILIRSDSARSQDKARDMYATTQIHARGYGLLDSCECDSKISLI